MLILTHFKDKDITNLYSSFEAFHKATFSPDSEYNYLILGNLNGNTYANKKACLRDLAIEYSWFDCGGLSWQEQSEISGFFDRMGRRYGLLTEFRENGIC